MKAKTDQEACDLLDRLVIASPCSIPWSAMQGDDRKRLCGGCSRFVHNISDMTKKEAGQFLAENGTSQCMIFYRRFDGTILTDDCPVGLRKIRNACKLIARVAAGIVSMLVALPGAMAQQAQQVLQPSKGEQQVGTSKRTLHMNQYGMMVDDDWKEPTPPPGFKYTGNPAGGGMVLRPISTEPNQPAVQVSTPTARHMLLGKPRAMPASPSKDPANCNTPDIIIKKNPSTPGNHYTVIHNHPSAVNPVPDPPAPLSFVPSPQGHANLDTEAQSFYEKGLAAAKTGKKPLAEFYFEKAIDSFDNQKTGDSRFRKELERALKSVQ